MFPSFFVIATLSCDKYSHLKHVVDMHVYIIILTVDIFFVIAANHVVNILYELVVDFPSFFPYC